MYFYLNKSTVQNLKNQVKILQNQKLFRNILIGCKDLKTEKSAQRAEHCSPRCGNHDSSERLTQNF